MIRHTRYSSVTGVQTCALPIFTDEGYAKVVATAPAQVDLVRRVVVDALTPAQLRQLGEISARLLDKLNPGGDCPTA